MADEVATLDVETRSFPNASARNTGPTKSNRLKRRPCWRCSCRDQKPKAARHRCPTCPSRTDSDLSPVGDKPRSMTGLPVRSSGRRLPSGQSLASGSTSFKAFNLAGVGCYPDRDSRLPPPGNLPCALHIENQQFPSRSTYDQNEAFVPLLTGSPSACILSAGDVDAVDATVTRSLCPHRQRARKKHKALRDAGSTLMKE